MEIEDDHDVEAVAAGNPLQFEQALSFRKDELLVPWTVATTSLAVFGIAASFVTGDELPRELPGYVPMLFWVLALGIATASIVLPRQALSKANLTRALRAEPNLRSLATRLVNSQVDRERLDLLSKLNKSEQRLLMLTQIVLRPMLIGLLCDELLAVVGLVYSRVAMNIVAGFPIMMLGFGLNVWHLPRLPALIERGRKLAPDDDLADFNKDLRQIEKGLGGPRLRKKKPRPK